MDDDPSLLVFRILGGPLAAELFSRVRVDGGEVLATTHTGARRYQVGEAFRVGDRSAAVVRVSRLGVPWGAMLLLWATAVAALSLTGYAGYGYLIVAGAMSLYWLCLALSGYRRRVDDEAWAKRQFGFSILMVMVLSLMMVVDFGITPARSLLAVL